MSNRRRNQRTHHQQDWSSTTTTVNQYGTYNDELSVLDDEPYYPNADNSAAYNSASANVSYQTDDGHSTHYTLTSDVDVSEDAYQGAYDRYGEETLDVLSPDEYDHYSAGGSYGVGYAPASSATVTYDFAPYLDSSHSYVSEPGPIEGPWSTASYQTPIRFAPGADSFSSQEAEQGSVADGISGRSRDERRSLPNERIDALIRHNANNMIGSRDRADIRALENNVGRYSDTIYQAQPTPSSSSSSSSPSSSSREKPKKHKDKSRNRRT